MAYTRKVSGASKGSGVKSSLSAKSNGRSKSDDVLDDDEDVALPTKPNEPPKNYWEYSWCIFGEKGIGKTELMSELFPGSVHYMLEPWRQHLKIIQIPKAIDPKTGLPEPALTWNRYRQYNNLIIDSGKYKAVIHDTLDRLYAMAADKYCHDKGIKHISDLNDYGRSYDLVDRMLEAEILNLRNSGIVSHYTSHAVLKETSTKTGRQFETITLTAGKRAYGIVAAMADFVVYLGYHGQQRSVTVRGDDFMACSCGGKDVFLTKDGHQIHEFYAGRSAKETAEIIEEGFKNKLPSDYIISDSSTAQRVEAESDGAEASLEGVDDAPKTKAKKSK